MESHVLLGVILIAAGLGEIPLGLVASHRIPPEKRVVVLIALAMSGLLTITLGIAFLMKLIPLG